MTMVLFEVLLHRVFTRDRFLIGWVFLTGERL